MKALDLLYPPRCMFCGGVSENGAAICGRCARRVALRENPLSGLSAPNARVQWAVAPYAYIGGVRHAVQQFKFHGDLRGRTFFGEAIAREIRRCGLTDGIDCVTFVPMTEIKERQRGFNQARLLAEYVAGALELPLLEGVLVREGMLPQHQLTAGFRARSAAASFVRAPDAALFGEGVLLVDDIITTGTTIAKCAKLLLEAGAGAVFAAAAAS